MQILIQHRLLQGSNRHYSDMKVIFIRPPRTVFGQNFYFFNFLAKQIIRNALRASENDAVIFCGSGATGGIQLLISAMALQTPPVVFIGPYEHHSAELPWINAKAHIVRIQEGQDGQPDYNHLEIALEQWSKTGNFLMIKGQRN